MCQYHYIIWILPYKFQSIPISEWFQTLRKHVSVPWQNLTIAWHFVETKHCDTSDKSLAELPPHPSLLHSSNLKNRMDCFPRKKTSCDSRMWVGLKIWATAWYPSSTASLGNMLIFWVGHFIDNLPHPHVKLAMFVNHSYPLSLLRIMVINPNMFTNPHVLILNWSHKRNTKFIIQRSSQDLSHMKSPCFLQSHGIFHRWTAGCAAYGTIHVGDRLQEIRLRHRHVHLWTKGRAKGRLLTATT